MLARVLPRALMMITQCFNRMPRLFLMLLEVEAVTLLMM
jgi:hypothetical protein